MSDAGRGAGRAAAGGSGEGREQRFLALIRGERRGPGAALLRALLRLLSWLFALAVGLRGLGYRLGLLPARRAPLPVISVGNLTAGGTGKTPLVIRLGRELEARGLRVAVLARGYGAARDGDRNDELEEVAAALPGALVLPGRDRVARAAEAAAQGAAVALLDDGFQHRRLARDLDLVLLDATCPFGPAGLLPRGLLREPPRALRRAHAVLLSRAELVEPAALAALEARVRGLGFRGPLGRMRVVPRALRDLTGGGAEPPTALAGRAVLVACGVGNPAAFRGTLERLGARVASLRAFPDHHAYGADDVAALRAEAAALGVKDLLVTAKDAVKLRRLELAPAGEDALRWWALEVEAEVDPPALLDELVRRVLPRG